jgi:rare lipoprotein A (peptidoglycan hydrolase)
MIDRAKNALSGVVVSVLLMGPALALPAQAQDTSGPRAPTPAEHRKTNQARQGRHNAALVQRVRRPPALHPMAGHAATRVAPTRTAVLLDDNAATTERQQSGLASWYGGHRWHGNRTSSGGVYDQDALTAAHASLPIGTRVRVTLVGSGRNVVVTINDRPGTRRRIIDLSRAAARELGILERGVAMVTLTPL